jgi:hypothetical protein
MWPITGKDNGHQNPHKPSIAEGEIRLVQVAQAYCSDAAAGRYDI